MRENSEGLKKRDFVGATQLGVRPPRQERSRSTFDAIVDAATVLCDGRDFSSVAVADICDKAGVSVSSFYARFEDRDALLQVLHERYLSRMFDAIDGGVDLELWQQVSVADAIAMFGRGFLDYGRRNDDFQLSIRRAQHDNPALVSRRRAFERASADLVVQLIEGRFGPLDGAAEIRVRTAFATMCAVLREAVSPIQSIDIVGVSEDRFLAELADQFCSYVDPDGLLASTANASRSADPRQM